MAKSRPKCTFEKFQTRQAAAAEIDPLRRSNDRQLAPFVHRRLTVLIAPRENGARQRERAHGSIPNFLPVVAPIRFSRACRDIAKSVANSRASSRGKRATKKLTDDIGLHRRLTRTQHVLIMFS